MKHVPWNKGLTKHNSEIIARISKKKSAWWKKEDRSETIARIGKASKGRVFPKMEKSKSWKGGRYVDSRDGYVLIYQPEHPNARGDGYVLEHRLVMSKKLGRPIHRNEDINHLNEYFNSILDDDIKKEKTPQEISIELNQKLEQLIKEEKYEEAIFIRDYMNRNNIPRIIL